MQYDNYERLSASAPSNWKTDYVEHAIDTADIHPMRQALHRLPVTYLLLIGNYVLQMQERGIVEPRAGSEWISNIVLLRKKDGRLRYCIDYLGLNFATEKANYLLPRIDACHDLLAGNTLFSSLNMHSGY